MPFLLNPALTASFVGRYGQATPPAHWTQIISDSDADAQTKIIEAFELNGLTAADADAWGSVAAYHRNIFLYFAGISPHVQIADTSALDRLKADWLDKLFDVVAAYAESLEDESAAGVGRMTAASEEGWGADAFRTPGWPAADPPRTTSTSGGAFDPFD